jgi:hypothetical protein
MMTVYNNEYVTGADTTYVRVRCIGWDRTASLLGTLIELIFKRYIFLCARNLGVVQEIVL